METTAVAGHRPRRPYRRGAAWAPGLAWSNPTGNHPTSGCGPKGVRDKGSMQEGEGVGGMRLQGPGTRINTGQCPLPSQGAPGCVRQRACPLSLRPPVSLGGAGSWAGQRAGLGRMPCDPGASPPIGLSAGEKGQGRGRALSMTWLDAAGRGWSRAWGGGVRVNRQWRHGGQLERGAEECPWVKRRPGRGDTDTGKGQDRLAGRVGGKSRRRRNRLQEAQRAEARGAGARQSSLAKPPMVTFRSGLVPTGSWSWTAPPPMKQKAGHTGPEQSRGHSRSPRKDTASRKETRPCS